MSNLTYAELVIMNNRIRTYKGIIVKYFDDDFRWVVSNTLWVTMDLDRVKNKCLVPGWTDSLLQTLRSLTMVEKYDSSKWICIQINTLFTVTRV